MLGVALLALDAAFCLAMTNICIRRGTRWASPNHGVFLSILVAPFFLVILATATGDLWRIDDVPWQAYVLFAAAGIIHYVLGRTFNYTAIRAIGASRSSVIRGATPVFAVAIAIPLLGESIGWMVGVGAAIIIAGSFSMTRGEYVADDAASGAAVLSEAPMTATRGITAALMASFLWGITPHLIKLGLNEEDVPILATLIAKSRNSTMSHIC